MADMVCRVSRFGWVLLSVGGWPALSGRKTCALVGASEITRRGSGLAQGENDKLFNKSQKVI